MELIFIILLLVAHYVGDFLFQSREVAKNKAFDNAALLTHGILLSIPMVIVMTIISVHYNGYTWLTPIYPIVAIVLYAALHMFQDRCIWKGFNQTVKYKGLIKGTPEFESYFFKILGADQLMHMIVLFAVIFMIIL